jgi:hypothetical protein
MKFSGKNTFDNEIGSENKENICDGRTWDEIEGKELEMINGMDSFIGKSSGHICRKSKEIMKEWRDGVE